MKNQKMRILTLFISLWFVINVWFVNPIHAQNNDFNFGVQTGIGLTESDLLNGDPSYGSYVYIEKSLTKIWFSQMGLSYNRYDAYEPFDSPEINFSNTRISYIENYIGIAAIGGVQFFNKVKLVLKAGSEVSYLVEGKKVEEDLTNGYKNEVDFNRDNDFRFGIIAGVGVIVPINDRLRLNLDLINNSAIRVEKDNGSKVYRPNNNQVCAGIQVAI